MRAAYYYANEWVNSIISVQHLYLMNVNKSLRSTNLYKKYTFSCTALIVRKNYVLFSQKKILL